MKKFNLEEALSGKPVVTRDGREVSYLTLFNSDIENLPLVGLVDGFIRTYTKDGKFFSDKRCADLDLFMASEKVTKWVNVFPNKDGRYYSSMYLHDTEQEAINNRLENNITVPITFEI